MPNFLICFSYSGDNDVVYRKTALVRASSPDVAKDKLVSNLIKIFGKTFKTFKFDAISVSSFNYLFT